MRKTTEIDAVIALNLKLLVGEKHGAQKRLAEKVKITPGSLNRIMSAKQHAGPEVVANLARALGVSEVALYQDHHANAENQPNRDIGPHSFEDAAKLLASFASLPVEDKKLIFDYLQKGDHQSIHDFVKTHNILVSREITADDERLIQLLIDATPGRRLLAEWVLTEDEPAAEKFAALVARIASLELQLSKTDGNLPQSNAKPQSHQTKKAKGKS